jgi:serine/threonine protein kinase
MAPEQVEGKPADVRTDIFALGLVLYEMATGKKAFQGETKANLAAAILTSQTPLITSIQPSAPIALERALGKCLNKDPEERWQTAWDLAGELKWILQDLASSGTSAASKTDDGPKARTDDDGTVLPGVSPAFIKDLQSLGYSQLSLEDVIKARMHGVDSNFIRELQSSGHKGLSLDELIKARQHGVDADFAKTLEPLGYSGLSLEQLIKLRNHGVNSEFIRAMRQEGYDKVSIDELIRLRNHGVNAEFIQRMKSQGFQKLSLDQLIKLRMAGM